MKKVLAALLTVTMAAGLLAGCGSSGSSSSKESTFKIGLTSDIVALDPIYAYDYTTNPVIDQITEGLLQFDQDNQLQPMLAKSWEQKDDTTYVYEIRDDVNFSDGNPMTMDDVLFSINRNMDKDGGSYLNWMFDDVESVEKTGDWELTVHLSQPSANWKYVFGTTAGHVIEKSYYEEHKDNFGTAEGGIVGTGPYVFDSWKSGQEIVLKKNDKYWDKDQTVAIDTLEYKIIPDDTTRTTALKSGEIDFTTATPPDNLSTLQSAKDLDVQSIKMGFTVFLAFNTQRAPFDDVNVRKAVTAAIDLSSIQDNIMKDTASEGTCLPMNDSLFTTNTDDWNAYLKDNNSVKYSLDEAKKYMAQSAYPDGFDCTLLTSQDSQRYTICLYIQEQLKELGINVNLQKLSEDEHTANQFGNKLDADGKRDYDMIVAGWEADYPDIAGNIVPLLSSTNAGKGGSNSAVYSNAQVDQLLSDESQSSDGNKRTEDLMQVMNIVNEDCPYIFLTYPNRLCTINKKYTGFQMNSSWTWNLFFKNIKPAE